MSRFLGAGGDYRSAQEALGRALAIARREQDTLLEMQILAHATSTSASHGHWQESIEYGLRTIELAVSDETALPELYARWFTAANLLRMGDIVAARHHTMVLRDLAEKRSISRQLASNCFAPLTNLRCLEGDWEAGREYNDRGLELVPLNPLLLQPRVLLELETGEFTQGEAYLAQLLDEAGRRAGSGRLQTLARVANTIPVVARITDVPDRLELAEVAATEVLATPSVTLNFTRQAKVGLALLAVCQGDQSAAKQHYAFLLLQRGTMILSVISVDRLLGLLSHTMGNLDQATVHFEDALTFCHQAGYRPELAWTCCDYSDALTQRGNSDDYQKAKDLLAESYAISTELGMPPLNRRVVSRQESNSSLTDAAPAYPDGLTPREVEVIRLIAMGRNNREIAEELHLTPGTVANHMHHILGKAGLANRTELAAYAFRSGLA